MFNGISGLNFVGDREDWSHAFYVGKLCEKLGYSLDESLSYYAQAIALNPSAVDPFYRMHASRLKLLCKCGKRNEEVLKVYNICLLYLLFEGTVYLLSTICYASWHAYSCFRNCSYHKYIDWRLAYCRKTIEYICPFPSY